MVTFVPAGPKGVLLKLSFHGFRQMLTILDYIYCSAKDSRLFNLVPTIDSILGWDRFYLHYVIKPKMIFECSYCSYSSIASMDVWNDFLVRYILFF